MRILKRPVTWPRARKRHHLLVDWAPKPPAVARWTSSAGAGAQQTVAAMKRSCARWWCWVTARSGFGTKWQPRFGGERTEIVDWWHSAEHLWDLSKVLHGDGTPEATGWAEHAKHLLWRHGPQPWLAQLQQTLAPNADALKVLQRERGFFTA